MLYSVAIETYLTLIMLYLIYIGKVIIKYVTYQN